MHPILAPGKIAVQRVEAELKGGLALPQTRAKAFDIAKVAYIGALDKFGYEGKEKTAEAYAAGDLVLFQIPVHIADMTAHNIKGVTTLFLNVTDIIARLDSTVIEMKSFHAAGRFVLLKPTIFKKEGSRIIIPGAAAEANKESIHFSVLQKGADVNIDVSIGQEVFPNRGRLNTIFVDSEEVCFIDQNAIDGVMA
jgi:co-chaperonin GroES (HSP10)